MTIQPSAASAAKEGVLKRYSAFLPLTQATPIITLGEGSTPLIRMTALEERTGAGEVWLKLEGCNPTGSFKDRGMVLAVAKAVEDGAHTVVCASTGNTSAAAAAYAARADIECVVVVAATKVAWGKIVQTRSYNARIVSIDADFDAGLNIARELSERPGVTLVNSINEYRLEGQKTAAFEVIDDLGDAPDEVFIPVGNAGNISAYWAGFCQYKDAGLTKSTPAMRGFQAEGAAPIVLGHPVRNPKTVASALRIGNPANREKAERARDESGGSIEKVSDAQILDAYRILGGLGVFCEPASAASVAGLLARADMGLVRSDSRVACVITGHGLKDPEVADAEYPPVVQCEANAARVAEALSW